MKTIESKNRLIKSFASGAFGLLLCASAQAQTYHFDFTTNGAIGAIPDNSPIGLTDARDLSSANIPYAISNVTLTLNLSGDAIGEINGYIRLGDLETSPALALSPDSLIFSLTYADFIGLNPNTAWTLFLADSAPGLESTLVSWSLDITTVPEPANLTLVFFGGFAIMKFFSRRRKSV